MLDFVKNVARVAKLLVDFLMFQTWLRVKLFYTVADVPWSRAAKKFFFRPAFDEG